MVSSPLNRPRGLACRASTSLGWTRGGDLERVIHGIYRLCGSPDDALSDLYARWLALDPARTVPERLGDAERTITDLYRDEPDESHVADVLADAIESGLTTRVEITAYIGTTNAYQLLTYRGLDPHTLASRMLDINGLTPAIQTQCRTRRPPPGTEG